MRRFKPALIGFSAATLLQVPMALAVPVLRLTVAAVGWVVLGLKRRQA